MGYGGAPSWVYKRDAAYREIMHQDFESKMSSGMSELRAENEALKVKIKQMEQENKDLRGYIDYLMS